MGPKFDGGNINTAMRAHYPGGIIIWSVGFCEGRKTGQPGENSTYIYFTGPESNPGYIQKRRLIRRALSLLRHLCIPASRKVAGKMVVVILQNK